MSKQNFQTSSKQLKTGNGGGGGTKNSKTSQNGGSESKGKSKCTRPKMASRMLDYEYHALSNGLMNSPNGSFKGSSSDGYHIFGPSSIKSSVDGK